MSPLSVVVADDSVLMREGVRRLLEDEGHLVLAAVGDADQLRAAVRAHRPQLAVVDVRMPPSHTDEGLRAALDLKAELPDTGVLVLSQYVVRDYATELLSAHTGGIGYLLKDRVTDIDAFLEAISRVAAGGAAIDPHVVQQLLVGPRTSGTLEGLTPRELEVLGEMAQGQSNVTIAERLHLSVSSVEKAVGSIFDKLDLARGDGSSRRVRAVLLYLEGRGAP
ncbi:response regulator [Nesterenkonia halobia]|uniref:Response regulator transcription factor n=1 Tax=Nesterenkonia halobia TaxID=37922 RepID=A0ABP6R769_9MICC